MLKDTSEHIPHHIKHIERKIHIDHNLFSNVKKRQWNQNIYRHRHGYHTQIIYIVKAIKGQYIHRKPSFPASIQLHNMMMMICTLRHIYRWNNEITYSLHIS